ncbi:MAG: PP2C family protein-serine/threonine phosphatase [Oscillatoriales cyanobacterium SM2_1_8]|nr:PP2C family protein-serine/threonine phosphatase [Oscillatoriales cyanobacterium SM2_1_8]
MKAKVLDFMMRSPRLAVITAIGTTCVLVMILSLNSRQAYQEFQDFTNEEFRLNSLVERIVYYDEVLTMSARMGAATGDTAWEKRYQAFVPQLEEALQTASQLTPDAFASHSTQQTDAANQQLIALEAEALTLVREGQPDAALKLLLGAEYEAQKKIYQQGSAQVLAAIAQRIRDRIRGVQQNLGIAQTVAAGGLGCLILLWSWVYQIIVRYSTTLKRINHNLEALVAERTQEIQDLNQKLKSENIRMAAELDITRRLQSMILPRPQDLHSIPDLDIVGFMEPAAEVGGDYFDVIHRNGNTKVSIGDVTGHGLESGVLMLMVQTSIRSLFVHGEKDLQKVIQSTNQTIFENVSRMQSEKNLSLLIINYEQGILTISGQHEHLLIVRKDGQPEAYDTDGLGFTVGLIDDISPFVGTQELALQIGDIVALYTDGVTEAANSQHQMYGLPRLHRLIIENAHLPVTEIQQIVVEDVRSFIGDQVVYDDITLVLIKRQN